MLEYMGQREEAKFELGIAEPPLVESTEAPAVRFPEPLVILAKRKYFIILFVGAVAVLSVVISLLLKNNFTANSKILPPQQSQSMSTTAMLSQLGPLAALAGSTLGLRNPSDIYVSMLKSRTVEDNIVDRFDLMKIYKAKKRTDARRSLEDHSLIVNGKDGVISISVEDHDPNRAAGMANAYVEELEKLTKVLAVTEASKRRMFFEREVKMAMDDLANAEVGLKQTQEKTGMIMLMPQATAIIEEVTSLRAGIAAKEVEIQAMRSFATAENPELMRAEQELAAMRVQLTKLERGQGNASAADVPVGNVPKAGLEYLRKLRDVKYHEALFELLAKQFEAAKIDEARDSLLVQQMDKAVPPDRKSGPYRSLIVLGSTFFATLLAVLIAFAMERLEQAKDDPQFVARLQLFKYYLRRRKA
jgi:tyrosine-protein kinase Etk/Wzc